jgi:hypothetical protein
MAGLVPGIHVLFLIQPKDVDGRDKPGHDEIKIKVRSRSGRWSVDPGFPTKVGGRRVSEPTSPVRDSSLKDR